MSLRDALQEIMTICEEKLCEGDYIEVSNHLKTIYNKPQKHQVIPVHIIRNYNRVISEDDQSDKNISFALTEEEQILVMKDRFRRYYETKLEELNESIKINTKLLKATRELKQDLYSKCKYSGCKEERSAHKTACMRERDIAKNIHELKTKLILVKQDMAAKLN
jgi:hypothetical protein